MTKTLRNLLLMVLVVLAAAGCHRRPLYDPSEAVRISIRVNVKTVTNVNANIRSSVSLYNSTESLWAPKLEQLDPETMRVLVYDPETNKLLTQSFVTATEYDEEGNKVFNGTLGISHGNYDFLVYNFDTPTTQVTYENDEKNILAYTNEIPESMKTKYTKTKKTKADGDEEVDPIEDLSIRYEPEHLLVANEKDFRISPHDTLVVVRTEAATVVDTYYLQIKVHGRQFASSATAIISGLSPSNKIGLNERTEDPSAGVIFDMQIGRDEALEGDDKDVLCAVFNTFGKIPDINSDLIVTFNVIDTAGNLQQFEVDLDPVFDSELCHLYHWLIIEDYVIDIKDPGQGGEGAGNGGFQPQVDDWEEEEGTMTL